MSTNVDERWRLHNEKLDAIPNTIDFLENRYFRKFITMPLSRNTKVMENEANLLLSFFNIENHNIIEVGAGFGNLCRVISGKTKVKSYTILDTPSMIRFSSSFLSHHKIPCNFIASDVYEKAFNLEFDLFMSNICMSELPEDYRQSIMDNIISKCKKVFIIDGCKPSYNEWLESSLRAIFPNLLIKEVSQEVSGNKYQKVHVGHK